MRVSVAKSGTQIMVLIPGSLIFKKTKPVMITRLAGLRVLFRRPQRQTSRTGMLWSLSKVECRRCCISIRSLTQFWRGTDQVRYYFRKNHPLQSLIAGMVSSRSTKLLPGAVAGTCGALKLFPKVAGILLSALDSTALQAEYNYLELLFLRVEPSQVSFSIAIGPLILGDGGRGLQI